MPRKFYTLDVFTDTPLSGNPLAVVLDSKGLDLAAMQNIAIEFNLSETVFVSPPQNPAHRASIRIFTPGHELPFAGHPTVGTAILLNELNHLGEGDELVLEEQVGPVSCHVSDEGGKKRARFELPKQSQELDWNFDLDAVAKAVGLERDMLEFDAHKVSLWDAGVPYTLVPVKSLEAVRSVKIDNHTLADIEPLINGILANFYVYCSGGEAAEADFHARMFGPFSGIPEDPATGSAAAAISGAIAVHEMEQNGSTSFMIEQGYEMGRPSQIHLDIIRKNGVVVSAGISGGAVIVSEGMFHI